MNESGFTEPLDLGLTVVYSALCSAGGWEGERMSLNTTSRCLRCSEMWPLCCGVCVVNDKGSALFPLVPTLLIHAPGLACAF